MNQAWHDARRKGIGGSDAPVIEGLSPWKTYKELWIEKVYGYRKDADNSATRRGRDLEEVVRRKFEAHYDCILFPETVIHPVHDYLRANLDGIDRDKGIVVEIKCPGEEDHLIALKGQVPTKYYSQCQHIMMVLDLDYMFYVSYYEGNMVVIRVMHDELYQKILLAKENEFWDLVQKKIDPDSLDKDWQEASGRWLRIKWMKDLIEDEEERRRSALIALSPNSGKALNGVKLSYIESRGKVDYKKAIDNYKSELQRMHPDIEFPDINFEAFRDDPIQKTVLRAM